MVWRIRMTSFDFIFFRWQPSSYYLLKFCFRETVFIRGSPTHLGLSSMFILHTAHSTILSHHQLGIVFVTSISSSPFSHTRVARALIPWAVDMQIVVCTHCAAAATYIATGRLIVVNPNSCAWGHGLRDAWTVLLCLCRRVFILIGGNK